MKRVENDNDAVMITVDPQTVVKVVTLGVCRAAMMLLQNRHGGSPTTNQESDVLTADEVAEMLRLDRKTVYDYAGRGEIPCQRLGKRILFSRTALVAWLSSCSRGSSESNSA